MGKRRMAYMSDAIPPPTYGVRELWGWLGEVDRTEWQWEAPTARPPEQDTVVALPGWLSGWDAAPEEDPSATSMEKGAKLLSRDITFGKEEVLKFQRDIQEANPDKILEICSQFNKLLTQSLIIGVVPETALYEALSNVTYEIGKACPESQLAGPHKFAFYQAVWDGISACKVFQLNNFRSTTMDRLLALISELPMSLQVRTLAHGILTCVSASQLGRMDSSITNLVKAWSRSWLNKDPIHGYEAFLVAAEETVKKSEHSVKDIQNSAALIGKGPVAEVDISNTRKILKQAKSDILLGIEAIKQVELTLFPVRASIKTLVDSLRNIAPDALHHIIESCSDEIARTCRAQEKDKPRIRSSWLSVIAQLPNANNELFTKTWQRMEDRDWYLPHDFGSDLVLSQMVSQGYIREPAALRNTFEAAPGRSTLKDYGFLLYALNKHQRNWKGASYLFEFLNKVKRHYSIYKAFSITKSFGLKPPVNLIREALETIAIFNPRLAFNIYSMYIPTTYSIQRLNLSRCPNFIISMIHDDLIAPNKIWKVLGIPLYEKMEDHEWPGPSKEPLPPAMIDLITKMAIAFARSEARPQRVALRNVMQCMHHLRRFGVPMPPELSRAISYAGITREIVRQNWVGKERLRWALSLVEYAEGEEVRNTVDTAIWHWRQHMVQKKRDIRARQMGNHESHGWKWKRLSPLEQR
jgi:hypothetical protein